MTPSFKRIACVSLGIIVACGLLVYHFFAMPAVSPHLGDGRFQNTSWRFPWGDWGMPVPGYEIDFPEFDLSQDFAAEYHIEQLPELPAQLGIYLSIRDPQHNWRTDQSRKQLQGQFRFEVVDERAHQVCQMQEVLGKMVWAAPEGGDYGLYVLQESFFPPQPGARYTLRVHYTGDAKLLHLKGFVHIRCGGSI